MKDKIVLITGANTGMGKITALELAKMGAHIIMVCRNKISGEAAQKEIMGVSNNQKIDLLICDLSLQKKIHELAATINKSYPHIDVLVNNAGLALTNFTETSEGIETTFATNVLSMCLLTALLADILKKAPAARVVNVASSTHTQAKLKLEDIEYRKGYSLFGAYNQSKLCNIILTYEFAKKFANSNVTVNCLNPGPVKTELARDMSPVFKFIGKLFFLTPEKASQTAIYLASSNELSKITGRYFIKCKPAASSKTSMDPEIGKKLWTICAKMTHVDLK
jgi:NAD(P)-dependent dehydrogenase (short-subunit alcohol dehydrogenase family)